MSTLFIPHAPDQRVASPGAVSPGTVDPRATCRGRPPRSKCDYSRRPLSGHLPGERHHQGFTLLETIVVLALLSVLMLLIWSAIGVARRADQQGQRWDQALTRTDAAQTYLRRALMHAQGDLPSLAGRPTPPVFIGSAQTMQFVARAPASEDNTGPKYNDLSVEDDDSAAASSGSDGRIAPRAAPTTDAARWLTLQLFAVTVDGSPRPWGTPQRLAGPLRNVTFSYRGTDAAGNDTGWLPRWPWPARLPRIVRIAATPSDGSTWTTMQIPLVLQSAEQQGDGS